MSQLVSNPALSSPLLVLDLLGWNQRKIQQGSKAHAPLSTGPNGIHPGIARAWSARGQEHPRSGPNLERPSTPTQQVPEQVKWTHALRQPCASRKMK